MKNRLLLFVIGLIFALSIGLYSFAQEANTESLWDSYGVPHVYGKID
jgi:acyl-homoserine-lactone acylase